MSFFIRSIPEDANSIRIGFIWFKIKTLSYVECALLKISKHDITYGQLKKLTGDHFKLFYK